MKNLVIAFLVVVAGVAAIGFYRGWFQVSTTDADHKPGVTISMDRDKINGDERKLKNVGHTGSAPADRPGDADRRP